MSEVLVVDDLTFEVRRSSRRQTVGITVDRSGELRLSVPVGSSADRVEKAVRQKRHWIYRKLAQKDLLFQSERPKEYVTGESFPYLGRHYQLRLVNSGSRVPLGLQDGRFCLELRERHRGHEHFVAWYQRHGTAWLSRRVGSLASRMELLPNSLTVRELGYRWGSCGNRGDIRFHWRVMLLPPRIIDYVIVHELAHLSIAKHNDGFWRLVERTMPEYVSARSWLAENASRYLI